MESVGSSASCGKRDVEALPEEGPGRPCHERLQIGQREVADAAAAPAVRPRGLAWLSASALAAASAPRTADTVEAERVRHRTALPRVALRGSKGCSGWRTSSGVADRPVRRYVEGVEQLAEGNGRRVLQTGHGVCSGVGDDEAVRGGHDRVEQQLAVLAAQVPLPGDRVASQDVVAVGGLHPRERAVLQPHEADDPVRHRAHRDHGAHREGAGSEVRPSRTGPPRPVEHRAQVRQPQARAARPIRAVAADLRLSNVRSNSTTCHACDGGAEAIEMTLSRRASSHAVTSSLTRNDSTHSVTRETSSASRPARSTSALGTSSSGRTSPTSSSPSAIATPDEKPVQATGPGVLGELLQLVGTAKLRGQPPPHSGVTGPRRRDTQLVVGEPEPVPDWWRRRELKDLGQGRAARRDRHELGRHCEQRVGCLTGPGPRAGPEGGGPGGRR